jgi:hypothetical protein
VNDRDVADVAALGAAIGSQIDWLPVVVTTVAGVLAIIWTCIRIYEWVRFRLLGKEGDPYL